MPEKGEAGREAVCSKQGIFFNCVQTPWVSREGALGLPYGKLSAPITSMPNTYMMLNMCQTLDFTVTYYIHMTLSINLRHICQYTHIHISIIYIYGEFLNLFLFSL